MSSLSPEQVLSQAAAVTAQLIEGGRELLRWQWDDRFSAALATVKVPHDQTVLARLASLFPRTWEASTLGPAPAAVKALAGDWGGLMAGQRLFTLDPEHDPLLFAAWWPWRNNTVASLRVSCCARGAEAKATQPLTALRGWFAL